MDYHIGYKNINDQFNDFYTSMIQTVFVVNLKFIAYVAVIYFTIF